jgi:membrane-bound ClpP family serine protease
MSKGNTHNPVGAILKAAAEKGEDPVKMAKQLIKDQQAKDKRVLKQKVFDLYTDQIEELNRLSEATGLKVAVILRKALDTQLNLPKNKSL